MGTNELLNGVAIAVGLLLLFWILARVAFMEETEESTEPEKAQPTAAPPAEEAPAPQPELTPLKIPPTIPHYGVHTGPMTLSPHGGGWSWPKRLNVYRRRREQPISGPPSSGG
jgi:hypothetical protein